MERYRILSGSWLKVIAMVAMAVDHTAHYLLYGQAWWMEPLVQMQIGQRTVSWYFLMRCIGRLAFPLFAFLLVEGYLHTSNRRRYGRNLLVFALLSEVPWALLHHGLLLRSHNVMFTLLLGFVGLWAIEHYRNEQRRVVVVLLGLLVISILFHPDYGGAGFAFIILLYTLRRHRLLQAVIGSCMLPMKQIAGLAFIPMVMYNGRRGFISGPWAKYLFYAFYPLHLIIIYFLQLTRASLGM